MRRQAIKPFVTYLVIGVIFLQFSGAPMYAGELEDVALADFQYNLEHRMNKGWIDALDDQAIIIDDLSYPITSELRIYDQNGSPKGVPSLAKGQFVAFEAREHLTTIYILPGKGNPPEVLEPSSASGEEKAEGKTLRYENGVWKN